MTREHDIRIWRVVEHHVHAVHDHVDCAGVRRGGLDETSAARGQNYMSIFAADAAGRWGDPEKVTDTSSDMSTAFISGIARHLPNATMTFDHYHLAAKLSEADEGQLVASLNLAHLRVADTHLNYLDAIGN
jgi:transposase